MDDFYLNLLDWSKSNALAVALGSSVYIWNATTADVKELVNLEDSQVSSVCWSGGNNCNYLSVGTVTGAVQIWDVQHQKMVRSLRDHSNRVGATAW
jgi:WD40 repeat protein